MPLAIHEKQEIALRYWAHGRGFHDVVRALDFGAAHHTGLRKDGVTPEFAHPIAVAHFLRTLVPGLLEPQVTLVAGLLHDVVEDHDVTLDEVQERFGRRVREVVALLTKKFGAAEVEPEAYRAALAADAAASVGKGADRIHNLTTMVGVFSLEKQRAYMAEAESLILPMLKEARRRHPEQEPIYENLKTVLTAQIHCIRGTMRAYEDRAAP